MVEHWQLLQRQSLPLEAKILFSNTRIRDWFDKWEGHVYVAFSGGKDSTVLLNMVRQLYPNVPGVFNNTGFEYPEVLKFIRKVPNIIWTKPMLTFREVIEKYGYPVVSKEVSQKIYEIRTTKSKVLKHTRLYGDSKGNGKLSKKWHKLIDAPFKISHHCCNILKKNPSKKYEKESGNKPFVGTLASDSRLRKMTYLKTGCNSYASKRPISTPLAIWKEKDIWEYIERNKLPYSTIYNKGYTRTGCAFCAFGIHLQETNKFELMQKTHPSLYKHCMNELNLNQILTFLKGT